MGYPRIAGAFRVFRAAPGIGKGGGVIITIFRSRLDPAQAEAYAALSKTMKALVDNMPGLISYKTYEARDGERVTIVEFADEESHNAWRDLPAHRKAMQLGKDKFYEEYKVQVCELKRVSSFKRDE